jgi:biotin carboxylase
MAHFVIYESWLEGHGRVLPGLLQELGHSWTFVTRNPDHYRLPTGPHPIVTHAEGVRQVETNSVDDALPLVERLVKERADAVFTVCDYYLNHVGELCRRLELPSAFCPAVATARDKALTRRRLDEAGIPNAAHLLTADLEAALEFARRVGYPLVCKPADLASSAFVRRVDSDAELHVTFAGIAGFRKNFRGQHREPAVLLEEWLAGDEFSVEAITHEGRTTILGVTDKVVAREPYFIEVGHQFPARLDEADRAAIHAYVTRCLAAIDFREGVSHTEVKLTPSGPRLVEINPRPGGNYIVDLVRLVTGVDQLEAQLAAALGRPYVPRQLGRLAISAASAMLIPDRAGTVTSIAGVDDAHATPGLARLEFFAKPPFDAEEPVDNGCYLGMLLVTDAHGMDAGARAQSAAGKIAFLTAEAAVV